MSEIAEIHFSEEKRGFRAFSPQPGAWFTGTSVGRSTEAIHARVCPFVIILLHPQIQTQSEIFMSFLIKRDLEEPAMIQSRFFTRQFNN